MRFIKALFRFLWRALDGLRKVMHLIVLLFIFLVIAAAFSPSIPVLSDKAALLVDPEGALVEQLSGDPLDRAISEAYVQGRPETLLRDLLDAIRAAKTDHRIKALVLDLKSMSGGGIAKLEELSAAVRDFRSSGKPVIAVGDSYDQSQYYVASNADEIYLDPEGMVLIEGFGYFRTFLKDAIDKLAIDVNIFRAGKFKSYTDQFSRSDMSDQDKEESRVWLESLWASYQVGVVRARRLGPTAISDYTREFMAGVKAKGGDTAAFALERGLVTEIKPRREVDDRLKALAGEDEHTHSFNSISAVTYAKLVHSHRALQREGRGKVGVLIASGEIIDGEQPPGTIGGESTAKLIRDARFDKDLRALVLRVDSPGGSVFASEMIRREVQAFKATGRPVIVSMSSTAASGGYYISMNADEIWASPSTLTGSIGVFAVFPTFERTLGKVGVTVDGFGTTPLSGALRLDRTLNEDTKQFLQASVIHEYQQFIGKVADARGKPVQDIDDIAQGRVWSGQDAKMHGLVDHLGLFQDALDAAGRRAGLTKDFEVKYIERPLGWRLAFAQQVNSLAARAIHALSPREGLLQQVAHVWSPFDAELHRLARIASQRESYYYCPCTVE